MARRTDYISFFGPPRARHRDFVGVGDDRLPPSYLVLPALAVAIIAVTVWWFAFREADANVGGVLTLADATIPTVLLPSGAVGDDPESLLSGVTVTCEDELTDWVTFQGSMTHQGCLGSEVPKIENPRIIWRVPTGIAGWLNSPIIVNQMIYVASAGVAQGTEDRRDGVYGFNLYTGQREWFFGATLDTNGISYGNGIIVATGDEGRVWGIDAQDGTLIWEEALGVATFGYPLIVEDEDLVVTGDADGVATAFDLRSGALRWKVEVDGPIRGGAASDGEMIVIAGENRDVVAVDPSGRELWRTEVIERDTAGALARIWASPTITADFVIVTMLREDVFVDPAVTILNKADGTIYKQVEDAAGIKNDWGSIRSSVAVVGNLLVYGEPYSNRLVAIDLEAGETAWDVAVGSYCFPHWPSPAVVDGQVILPRHDGGLYAVDVETQTLVWSIYLGDSSGPGNFPPDFGAGEFCEWAPVTGYSVLASPAVASNGYVVVGTLEGYLFAIGDRSW